MKTFPSLSLIQKQRLYDIILVDPDTLEWKDDTYKLSTWFADKQGYVYTIRFTFNNGWLFVEAEHRMGAGFRHTWDQDGERMKC